MHPLRRKYIVSRSQVHLLAFNVVYYVVFTLVLSVVLVAPMVVTMTDGETHPDQAVVARLLLYVNARIWPVAGLMIAVSTVHSIFITHRVVGPLVRFRRAFGDVAAGRLAQRITLRPGDYLDDEVADLNAMITALGSRVKILRALQGNVASELREVERAVRAEEDASPRLETLRARLEELEGALDWFDCGEGDAIARIDVEDVAPLIHAPNRPADQTAKRS